MGTVNFYVKDPNASKDTIIYIKYLHRREIVVKISTGEKILPANWDKQSQRMRKRAGLPYINFNRNLDMIERKFNDMIYELSAAGILNENEIKARFAVIMNRVKKVSLYDYLDQLVESDDFEKTKCFRTLKNLLINFSTEKRKKIDFDLITEKTVRDFIEFMNQKTYKRKDKTDEGKFTEIHYSSNYISKMIKTFRRAMNYARDAGLHKNPVKISNAGLSEEVYKVYLTEDEIRQIQKTALPAYLERARDLFIIGCYTGMRVGNYLKIDPKTQIDLQGGFIYAIVNKNGPRVQIPIHREVSKIIKKYNGLPESISEQELNDYLKDICRTAKLRQPVIWSRTEGGKRVKHVNEKWEMITTHTARRSFATNAKKAGIPDYQIMQITGHSTLKSFYTYIKITQEETAEELARHPFFN